MLPHEALIRGIHGRVGRAIEGTGKLRTIHQRTNHSERGGGGTVSLAH